MAILSCDKISLEIRFRSIDESNHIQYDAWLRYNGRPLINPAILEREDAYWGDRRGDALRAQDGSADGADDELIPTLQAALETNQPRAWFPSRFGFALYIYPEVHFPPLRKDDFDTPFSAFQQTGGLLGDGSAPDDTIFLYFQTNLENYAWYQHANPGSGIGLQLSVERRELQEFIDDLKYEYTELLRRFPRHQERMRKFKVLQLAFDPTPRMLEVYFFQGEMTGWITMNLTVDGVQRTVWTSAVFPPYREILGFLAAVAEERLPCECWIDEEGSHIIFSAEPWSEPGLFRFKMLSPEKPHYQTHMDYIFDRRQFVLAFYNDLVSFLATHFQPRHWGEDDLTAPDPLGVLRRAVDGMGTTP